MFVSRSLDYALRSMIHLADTAAGNPVSLRQIAEATLVPGSYLAKLMRTLVRAELVHSDTGVHGGYRLARHPDAISLKEIYESVEGTFHTVVCSDGSKDDDGCELWSDCPQVSVWADLEREIGELLAQRCLADFLTEAETGPAEPAEGAVADRFVAVDQIQPQG